MPEYLAPGVFVEETTFRQKTIEGVGTSTAAFVGPARFGPVDGEPELLTSFGDYQRVYGGLDRLLIGSTAVDNHLAHGVRAFFENGGRRCYVSRVVHSDVASRPVSSSAVVSTGGPGGSPRLDLRGRHPGRAGNFEVVLTLRLSPNIFDGQTQSGAPPVLRGAQEYDVVLIDQIDDGGTRRQGRFAYLHDAFDAAANRWTFSLRDTAASGGSYGLVTQLDPSITADVRILSVDVEVNALGRFLDAQSWQGLTPHPDSRRSLTAVFGPPTDKATELYIPLLIERVPAALEGPAIAELLLASAGSLDELQRSVFVVTIDADGGTFSLSVDGTATADIPFDVNAATVEAALAALPGVGAGDVDVSSPGGGPFEIDFGAGAWAGRAVQLTANGTGLTGTAAGVGVAQQAFTVTIDISGDDGTFVIEIDGAPTAAIPFDADAAAVQAAVDGLPSTAPGDITVSGDGPYELSVPGELAGAPVRRVTVDDTGLTGADAGAAVTRGDAVYLVTVSARSGTFALTVDGETTRAIPFDAPAAVVQAALEELPGVATGDMAVSGPGGGPYTISFQGDLAGQAVELVADGVGLTGSAASVGVRRQTPGVLAATAAAPQIRLRLADGTDGTAYPDPDGYRGQENATAPGRKSGLLSVEDLSEVAIVAAPGSTHDHRTNPVEANARIGLLITHCERMRYRIAVVDAPASYIPGEVLELRGQFDSSHAAFYYPWVTVYDPVTRNEIDLPPSGFVAGIYARNDVERGVHKAPANEVVRMALGFEISINTAQQELLNPEGVNCFRLFEGRGRRLWGARTMTSDPEWKYVNLRRYFAFLERSIDKGTQWAVFEPNGPRLWANVQRTVEDFLFNEFVSGHLLGSTTDEAYFVRCDRSTMTQNDLDNGRLVCLIGVSPLRPAEFVIFRIGQKTLEPATV